MTPVIVISTSTDFISSRLSDPCIIYIRLLIMSSIAYPSVSKVVSRRQGCVLTIFSCPIKLLLVDLTQFFDWSPGSKIDLLLLHSKEGKVCRVPTFLCSIRYRIYK